MERHSTETRDNWPEIVESQGLNFHTIDSQTYWDESAYYSFTADEIDRLESATDELNQMCHEAVKFVIKKERLDELKIPGQYHSLVTRSWNNKEKSMYGRFDLAFNRHGEIKLLEYNADTPTSLLESSVIQWFWLKDKFPASDQFNSIHEKLEEFWQTFPSDDPVHFACANDSEEDLGNTEYIHDLAMQAGYSTKQLFIEDIGWASSAACFADLDNMKIMNLFKLYPWEWIFSEPFGSYFESSGIRVIEPPWKIILSNKGILAVLWELFPNHPNLLPAYFENRFQDNYVRKPFFSREGENVAIFKNGSIDQNSGTYGSEGYVYQQYQPLESFEGNFPLIGSWVINDQAAGIGIREDSSEITSNTSRFLPHLFFN